MKYVTVDRPFMARAFSFFWLKRVYLGRRFFELPPNEQLAAIRHEEGHCDGHHTELRVLCLLLAPWLLGWLCRRQEFEADRYSSQRGHTESLLQILKDDKPGTYFSPSHRDRRERILQSFTSKFARPPSRVTSPDPA